MFFKQIGRIDPLLHPHLDGASERGLLQRGMGSESTDVTVLKCSVSSGSGLLLEPSYQAHLVNAPWRGEM